MDDLTFPAAFINLLKLHEHPTTAAQILTAMEAPYLFLQRDGHYIAGNGFLSPKWLHMYLRPLGLRLTKHTFARAEVGIFLKNNAPAIVQLANHRYVCVHARSGQRVFLGEKYTTLPTLIKHSPDQVTAYTLEACPAEPMDSLALLVESARTLPKYAEDIASLLHRTVTRQDMQTLHTQYFRALMVDLPRLACHYQDEMLQEELRLLHHAYQHLFVIGEEQVDLWERLSRKRILTCLSWLRENIIDRMYALGASDSLLEQCIQSSKE